MQQASRSSAAISALLSVLVACAGKVGPSDLRTGVEPGGPDGSLGNHTGTDGDAGRDAEPDGAVAALRCSYPAALAPELVNALESGSVAAIADATSLSDAALALLEAQRVAFDADLIRLFNLDADGSLKSDGSSLDALNWYPTHDAALLRATPGENVAAIVSNDRVDGDAPPEERALAVLGRFAGVPYLAMASNPFRTNQASDPDGVIDAQLDQFLVNAMDVLAPRAAGATLHVVLAQLDQGYWFPDETSTRAWLQKHYPNAVSFNDADQCDGPLLAGCLQQKPDILIVSQDFDEASASPASISQAVAQALKDGTPVLYFNVDGGINALGEQLLALLQVEGVGDNYWSKLRASKLNGAERLGQLPAEQRAIRELLEHLKSGTYDFSLADLAAEGEHPVYEAQFGAGARAVRTMMNRYDLRAQDIFGACGNELPKLLALLGDRLRQDIVYPLTIASSTPQTFLRAYYADHAVYNSRTVSPAQPDRGTFDAKDLSTVVAGTKTVDLMSRRNFRSAGVYALPGRTMKVTRLDTAATQIWLFVNSLRSGSTHEWEDDNYGGYSRPKFIQSAPILLAAGQTIIVTNPYGGPVQLKFDQSNLPVQLRFENVGEHPHWRGPDDDASFAAKLAEDTYSWVEVATNGFELHSSSAAFRDTMKDTRWNTPALLAAAIEKYTYNDVHVLAGFQGEGIDKLPEVYGWALEQGMDVPVLDYVKHGNMDQPTCGYGCSGNPYDAGWSFSPIGHGDLHELGHSLQNSRFQYRHADQSYGNHAVTNWSPFYAASRYFEEHGAPTTEWKVGHQANFVELQKAYQAGDRVGTFSSHMDAYFARLIKDDDNITNCYSFFMQAMLMARDAGALQNGYHIVPRIHLIDRSLRSALESDASWSAGRSKLGFSQFSREAAQAISNNDFIAIALSRATELDYRDFMAMWGISVSAAAKAQIASYSYPSVARAFFALDPAGHAHGAMSTHLGDFQKLPIDGTSTWPAP